MKKIEVILGLGSNVGDKREYLRSAISELSKHIDNIRTSSIYESPALLPENAPPEWDMPFYNMAIAGSTKLLPQELLSVIKKIEKKLGRNKIGHWSPREIDIDILAMGNLVIAESNLTIPHRDLLERDFALIPLSEIAPDWLHPVAQKTATELLSSLPASNIKQLTTSKLVGIINITPDSFSDGGKNFTPQAAIKSINQLIQDGADIIDIGAESTRPDATLVTQEEEWKRLEPVLKHIHDFHIPVSVDTRYAKTAKESLKLGARWINDVSGFNSPEMVAAVRDSDCKLVVMHSLTVPASKNITLPLSSDPVDNIINWAKQRFYELKKAGITEDRIIFDPGIGFGKNAQQSMEIINNIHKFKILGVPILIGHSRKSFIDSIVMPHLLRHPDSNQPPQQVRGDNTDKDYATIEISRLLSQSGVDYLRVHNVKRHRLEI